jgi:hypothetical protein
MWWELWDVESGNMIGTRDTEADALALVRNLVDKGWPIAALSMIYDDDAWADQDLPPAITGDELARKAGIATARATPAAPPDAALACSAAGLGRGRASQQVRERPQRVSASTCKVRVGAASLPLQQ